MTEQVQKAGDDSVNVQAGGNVVVNHGISYSEARQIAVDVVKQEIIPLQNAALRLVKERIDHVADQIVAEVKARLNDFSVFGDPDFQYILHSVGVSYARSGDKDIEALLVKLVGERATETARSTKQSILNEAIEIGGRLTGDQLKILASLFLPMCTRHAAIDLKSLGDHFSGTIAGPLSDFREDQIEYTHLDFLRCLSQKEVMINDLLGNIREEYAVFFAHGITIERFPKNLQKYRDDESLFKPKATDPSWLVPVPLNKTLFQDLLISKEVPEEDIKLLVELYGAVIFNTDITKGMIVDSCQKMETVFTKWGRSSIKNCQLTSVGKVLAISYLRNIGVNLDFDKWLR